MAYACPVCDSLAPDGEHLAHHLAIVAMSRGGEHETWLDEHAAGWREESPETLASLAVERAEEVDHELADSTAGERPDVGHDHGGAGAHEHGHAHCGVQGRAGGGGAGAPVASDEETQAVLAEAREITQRMLGEDGADDSGEGGDGDSSGDGDGDSAGEEAAGSASEDASAETDSDE